MSDRLKLSDLKTDPEADEVADELMLKDLLAQERELKLNIAEIGVQIEREKQEKAAPKKSTNNKIGARKEGSFKAISTAPSINKTPIGPSMVPIPYPTTQDLSSSIDTARTVSFNGCPAYVLDGSKQPRCTGDEPGTGKGVKSGTVSGEVKPVQGSGTVRIEGKKVVRDGDACTMNGGNNPGIYVTVPTIFSQPTPIVSKSGIASGGAASATIWTDVEEWMRQQAFNLAAALQHPFEGFKGAVKGSINTIPQTVELIAHALAEQRASDLEDGAAIQALFGQKKAARELKEVADVSRNQVAEINLSKFQMSNSAQEGGDLSAAIAQIVMIGGALSKVSGKAIRKTIKPPETAIDVHSRMATIEYRDGVKISVGYGPRVIKSMNRGDLEKWFRDMHGISDKSKLDDMINSFDSTKPIELVELPNDTIVIQYVRGNGAVGTFYAQPGTLPAELAISGEGRVLRTFSVSEPVQMIRGTAAEFPVGKYPGVGGPGGGIQLIAPRGSKSFTEITGK